MIRNRLVTLLAAMLIAAPLIASAASPEDSIGHCHTPAEKPPDQMEIRSLPDVEVVDQNGRKLRFATDLVGDRVVAINSIFTTCTTICPALGLTFTRLQREMPERVGRDVLLISISVDPENDTPQRLKAWAAKFGAPPGWTLVTGKKRDIDVLLKALGTYTADFRNHQPVTVVGSIASPSWQRLYGFPPADRLGAAIHAATPTQGHSGGTR